MEALLQPVQDLLGVAWVPVWTLVKIFAIILPLMIFHQLQLLACAAVAQRYARRASDER